MSALQTVDEFCRDNGLSRPMFYKLRRQGKAPRIAKLGTLTKGQCPGRCGVVKQGWSERPRSPDNDRDKKRERWLWYSQRRRGDRMSKESYNNPTGNSKGSAGPSSTPPTGSPTIRPGLELRGRYPVGRDPRRMTQDELSEAGHEPMSPLQALRTRCLDCCGYQEKEVARCRAVDCPAWPFRMGTNPWRKPPGEARREAARQVMTKLNAGRRKREGAEPPASPPERGIAPLLAAGSGTGLTLGHWASGSAPKHGIAP
jgi:hypothetical protein